MVSGLADRGHGARIEFLVLGMRNEVVISVAATQGTAFGNRVVDMERRPGNWA